MLVLLECAIEFLKPDEAAKKDIDQWWKIYRDSHYVDRDEFMKRFMSFDRIVFFREYRTKRIVGGTGFRMREYTLSNGKRVNTIYIAQSYIIPEYRGRRLLSISYTRVVMDCKLRKPFQEIWFWMDAISYKPYLILGNHVLEHYPSPGWPTPKWICELRDRIGEFYYPGMYDRATGVVRKPSRRLKHSVGRIEAEDRKNAFIKFYEQSNPGHVKGEGLLCVFPGNMKNVINFLKLNINKIMSKRNGN